MNILWLGFNILLSCNFIFWMCIGDRRVGKINNHRDKTIPYFSYLVAFLVIFGVFSQILQSISIISVSIPLGTSWYDILFNLSWLYLIAQIISSLTKQSAINKTVKKMA